MMVRSICYVLCVALVIACGARAQQPGIADLAGFPKGSIEIRAGGITHRFDVWVADTPQRQAQGLMFVRDLPADRGMLFVHVPPRPVSMWMKNTYVELDMLFVSRGRIVSMARHARPHSLKTIESGVPVSGVIEIRGGEIDRRGLMIGDSVRIELAP